MMKFWCLIVSILCTIGVSTGGRLTKNCLSTNGTCGSKGLTCDASFGQGMVEKGRCCNGGPCCKSPCVPCPEGYNLLDDQTVSPNCFYYSTTAVSDWNNAQEICSRTDGAYLWRPNSEEEASAVRDKFTIPMATDVWTGANDFDEDGFFKFVIDGSSFSFVDTPFGTAKNAEAEDFCVSITLEADTPPSWRWVREDCYASRSFVCEVSPTITCSVP